MSPKTLVIGLDAATWDVIDPMVKQGQLPHLAGLIRQGVRGPLRSVPNLNSYAAWTTFQTGKNPGKHGVFWFYETVPGSNETRFVNGAQVRDARFWELASDGGQQVGVINVPMTYPAKPLNGFMIAGMDTPDESSADLVYPPDLDQELRRVGGYRIDTNILGYARSGRWQQALDATRQVIEERARAASHLARSRPWDLFVVVFTALDRVQHAFWQEPRATEESGDPRQASDIVRQFYALLDAKIGELINAAGPEANVLLCSDHGMGLNPMSNLYLQPWLESLGLFHPTEASPGGRWQSLSNQLLRRAAAAADGLLSKRLRRRIMSWLPGGRAKLVNRLHQSPCDWSRTQAYGDYIRPGIWINLRGREPHGIVEPGPEYEALRDRIIKALSACRDAATDGPIVHGVYRREEVYHGPYLDKAPDIHIDWNYDIACSGYRYENEAGETITVGDQADMVERRNINGDHRPDGIWLLSGPNIRRGQTLAATIADLAPTLLYALGLPIPTDMDGQPLTDAFEPGHVAAHPPHKTDPQAGRAAQHAFSTEEAQQIEERLRGLGYLE